jgi:hypothetical protein
MNIFSAFRRYLCVGVQKNKKNFIAVETKPNTYKALEIYC